MYMSIDDTTIKDDVRTSGEIITDIRTLLTEIDTRLSIIYDELDVLRYRLSGV